MLCEYRHRYTCYYTILVPWSNYDSCCGNFKNGVLHKQDKHLAGWTQLASGCFLNANSRSYPNGKAQQHSDKSLLIYRMLSTHTKVLRVYFSQYNNSSEGQPGMCVHPPPLCLGSGISGTWGHFRAFVSGWRSWRPLCYSAETSLFTCSPHMSPRRMWWGNTCLLSICHITAITSSSAVCQYVFFLSAVCCEEARGSSWSDDHCFT